MEPACDQLSRWPGSYQPVHRCSGAARFDSASLNLAPRMDMWTFREKLRIRNSYRVTIDRKTMVVGSKRKIGRKFLVLENSLLAIPYLGRPYQLVIWNRRVRATGWERVHGQTKMT